MLNKQINEKALMTKILINYSREHHGIILNKK